MNLDEQRAQVQKVIEHDARQKSEYEQKVAGAEAMADQMIKAFVSWATSLGIPPDINRKWKSIRLSTSEYYKDALVSVNPVFYSELGVLDASVKNWIADQSVSCHIGAHYLSIISDLQEKTRLICQRYGLPAPTL